MSEFTDVSVTQYVVHPHPDLPSVTERAEYIELIWTCPNGEVHAPVEDGGDLTARHFSCRAKNPTLEALRPCIDELISARDQHMRECKSA